MVLTRTIVFIRSAVISKYRDVMGRVMVLTRTIMFISSAVII